MQHVLSKLRRRDWGVPHYVLAELGVPNAQAIYEMLYSILDSMEQDEYTQALRNAFGAGELPASLTDRRQQLANELSISVVKVRHREEVAIDKLADKLLVIMDARASVQSGGQDSHVTALLGVQQAMTEQTEILREVNERLKRLGG